MSGETSQRNSEEYLQELVEKLLTRDREAHAEAVEELAEHGDERVIPHLVELVMVDSIANNWTDFGFPEVIREEKKPRYFELPEAEWPGIVDVLGTIAEPDYDSEFAWVEWESWYSQQDIEPLPGFKEWKLQLYKSFIPPVGALLDVEPYTYDIQDVRYGNSDRSFLAALNEPEFVPWEKVHVDGEGGEYERYLQDDEEVYGFEIDGQTYTVPRIILFPHEFMNATIEGEPVMLSWCTLCNAPILYDRCVEGRTLTFGNTGMLWNGNKVMYDEETESLWAHHSGRPMAGHYLEEYDELTLDVLPVSRTEWKDWKEDNPDTLVPHMDTGYGYDYQFYDGNIGFFEHYWQREDIVQPGVTKDQQELPEKEDVYGITSNDPDSIHIYPIEAVTENGPLTDTIDDRDVVIISDVEGHDTAVYEAPSLPVERDGDRLVDADGTEWEFTADALVNDDDHLERVPGRHGLWFAFRIQYDEHHIVEE